MAKNRELQYDSTDFNNEGKVVGRKVSTVSIRSKTIDDFYMTFTRFVNPVHQLTSANDSNVLGLLCKVMDYKNQARLTTSDRKEICRVAKITSSVLSRSIASLKDKGLITGSDGVYDINPFIFWKGSAKEREQLLTNEGLVLKVKFLVDGENN